MYFLLGNHINGLYNQNQYFKNGILMLLWQCGLILIDFISHLSQSFQEDFQNKKDKNTKSKK